MSLEAAISFFIAIFIFGITPGPGTFALLSKALNSGVKDCVPLSLGMTISDIVYLILASFGLAAIAENYVGLFLLIRFVGATYLIYLGYKMWTAKVMTDFNQLNNKSEAKSWISGFIQGFLISASNPKVILFYIAFLPSFMDLSLLNGSDVLLISVLTFFALMIGLSLISFVASSVRQYLKSNRAAQRLNKTAGSIMIGAGLFLISQGGSS